MAPLNQPLFDALSAACDDVRIVHEGEQRQVRKFLCYDDFGRPYMGTQVVVFGEQYGVNCPLCGDQRNRLLVSYRYGLSDGRGGRNTSALHCFNDQCHEDRRNLVKLADWLRSHGYVMGGTAVVTVSSHQRPPTPPPTILLPHDLMPINRLPANHPAADYILERGFNRDELWLRWGVSFCDSDAEAQPRLRQRIVIPIYRPKPPSRVAGGEEVDLAGWQARHVGEASKEVPKYLTASGMRKSKTLYGLPEALHVGGPVIVCEGAVDCWSVGFGAVALFGKSLSRDQERLLVTQFRGRPILVILDRDAPSENERVRGQLQAARRRHGDRAPVMLARLPQGRKDPGESTADELQRCLDEALGPAHRRQRTAPPAILGASKRDVVSRVAGLGTWIAAAAAVDTAPEEFPRFVGLALAGKSKSPFFVVRKLPATFEVMSERRVIFDDALKVRGNMGEDCAFPKQFDDVTTIARLLDYNEYTGSLATLPGSVQQPGRPFFTGCSPAARVAEKALQDADHVRAIFPSGKLQQALREAGLERVYQEIELPVVEPVAAMMRKGILGDRAWLRARPSSGKHAATIAGLLEHVDEDTGRIHCRMDPMGTVSGRIVCSKPGLQTIPRTLRRAFVADEGCRLLGADFNAFELRILAHFSQDDALLAAFADGRDVHRQTAALVLGKAGDDVTDEERQLGKKVNFSVIYGQTPSGLGKVLGLSIDEAGELIEIFLARYPGVADWVKRTQRRATELGHVVTLHGRRRCLPGIQSDDAATRGRALRQAVNFVIQGTAGDIFKLALVRVFEALKPEEHLLLPLHDAILLEAPEKGLVEAQRRIRSGMEVMPADFSVPLQVTINQGRSWDFRTRQRSEV